MTIHAQVHDSQYSLMCLSFSPPLKRVLSSEVLYFRRRADVCRKPVLHNDYVAARLVTRLDASLGVYTLGIYKNMRHTVGHIVYSNPSPMLHTNDLHEENNMLDTSYPDFIVTGAPTLENGFKTNSKKYQCRLPQHLAASCILNTNFSNSNIVEQKALKM